MQKTMLTMAKDGRDAAKVVCAVLILILLRCGEGGYCTRMNARGPAGSSAGGTTSGEGGDDVVAATMTPPPGSGSSRKFTDDFYVTWGAPNNARVTEGGRVMELALDNVTASGFASKGEYLFGRIAMRIRLPAGDSAGTVTAFYMSSPGSGGAPSDVDLHDEVDFEFLGNVSGQPYVLQTNVFANGTGGREQRMFLWFDPSSSFHSYSLLWTPSHIVILVDDVPVRRFPRLPGRAFPNRQPMRVFASIWNGEAWATRGGLDRIDWSHSPFVSSFANYSLNACLVNSSSSSNNIEDSNDNDLSSHIDNLSRDSTRIVDDSNNSDLNSHVDHSINNKLSSSSATTRTIASCSSPSNWWFQPSFQTLSSHQLNQLKWVHNNYLIYDYCTDAKRYPVSPVECTL